MSSSVALASPSPPQALARTSLFDLQKSLGAHFVPFAGYEMALRFSDGVLAEHTQVRQKAGLFDVSHMGQADIHAEPALLEEIFPMALASLPEGGMRYGLLLTDAGGIHDDVIITRLGAAHFRIVVNAARREEDYALIEARLQGRGQLTPFPALALLALQGPMAAGFLAQVLSGVGEMSFMTARRDVLRGIGDVLVSRSGYTGEDGFEVSLPAERAERFARLLLSQEEIRPIGLAARDSLRLEAGLCLYGQDMDVSTSPKKAGLLWTIPKDRRATLPELGDTDYKRTGFMLETPRPARAGWKIHRPADSNPDEAGEEVGHITSAGVAPTSPFPLAMGYLRATEAKSEGRFWLKQGTRQLSARICALPFRAHSYYRG